MAGKHIAPSKSLDAQVRSFEFTPHHNSIKTHPNPEPGKRCSRVFFFFFLFPIAVAVAFSQSPCSIPQRSLHPPTSPPTPLRTNTTSLHLRTQRPTSSGTHMEPLTTQIQTPQSCWLCYLYRRINDALYFMLKLKERRGAGCLSCDFDNHLAVEVARSNPLHFTPHRQSCLF